VQRIDIYKYSVIYWIKYRGLLILIYHPIYRAILDEKEMENRTINIDNPIRPKYIIIAVIIGFAALTAYSSYRIVDPGHRGVLVTFGEVGDKIYVEGGPYFVIPFVQDIILMNVQTLKISTSTTASSADLQVVSTTIAVNYHVDPGQVNTVYQSLRLEYADRVIAPAIQESVKAGTAQFSAEELITKRATVRQVIQDDLLGRLQKYGIVIENVLIEDFDFSAAFNAAIEAKVRAEQEALEAERILDKKIVEAQQAIAVANGTAQAIRLVAQANADAILFEAEANAEALRIQKLEVTTLLNQFKAIEKWNGELPQFMGGDTIPFIDITSFIDEEVEAGNE